MAWNDIAKTEKYQGLTPEDQASAKTKYWNNVAAPKVQAAGKDVNSFKDAFFGKIDQPEVKSGSIPNYQPKQVSDVSGGSEVQDNNLAWLKQAADQPTIDKYQAKGSIGMVEAYQKLNKWKMLPFLSGKATYDDIQVFRTMQKAQNGEEITEEQNTELQDFVNDMIEVESRGYSFGGGVTNAVLQMPAFAVEFVATGGAVTAGRKAVSVGVGKLVEKGTEKAIKKNLRQRIVSGSIEKVGMATGRTALMPHRIADSLYQRKINDSISITDKGEVWFKESDAKPAVTVMKAIGDVFIENLSEDLGGALITPGLNKIGAGIRRVGKPVKRVVPEALRQGFSELVQKTTNSTVREGFEKLGYNGLLEEIGEERIGALLRTSLDIDSEDGYSTQQFLDAMFPDADEFLVEVGAIATFGGVSRSTQIITNHLQNRKTPQAQIDQVINNMSETEKDTLVTEITERETAEQVAGFDTEITRIQEQVVTAGRTQQEAEAFTGLLEARTAAMADTLDIPREQIIKRFGLDIQKGQSEIISDIGVNLDQEIEDIPFFQSADAYNAEGEVKTESPQFKRWFAESKVVDSSGDPLVVFHGGTELIEEFSEDEGGATTGNNEFGAFYFTNEKEVGEDYSRQAFLRRYEDRDKEEIIDDFDLTEEQADKIIEDIQGAAEEQIKTNDSYLDMQNPYIIDMEGEVMPVQDIQGLIGFLKEGEHSDNQLVEELRDSSEIDQDIIDDYKDDIEERAMENNGIDEKEDLEDHMIDEAQAEILEENEIFPEIPEYDGIIVKNTIDDISDQSAIEQDVYIAFKPNQIKSVNNSGQFSQFSGNVFEQFAGEKAETASQFKLKTAQRMLNAGMNKEIVRKTTGWFKGDDGKFRFEISDADAELIAPKTFKDLSFSEKIKFNVDGVPLSKYLKHDKLFAAYPEFADINVKFTDSIGNAAGAANTLRNELLLNDKFRDNIEDPEARESIESILLHEVQHFIQAKEEFSVGGSPDEFRDEFKSINLEETSDTNAIKNDLGKPLFNAIYEFIGNSDIPVMAISEKEIDIVSQLLASRSTNGKTKSEIKDFIENNEFYKSMNDNVKEMRQNLSVRRATLGFDEFDTYHRLYGEVEARNVQKRAKLTDKERRKKSPQSTQDVADSSIIVKFDDGTTIKSTSLSTERDVVSIDGLESSDIVDIQELLMQAAVNKGTTIDKLKINSSEDLADMFKAKKQAKPKSLGQKLKAAGFNKDNSVLKDYALLMGFDPHIGKGHILRPKGKIIDETDLSEFLVINGYMTDEQVADRANVEFALENADSTFTEEEQNIIDSAKINDQNIEAANERIDRYTVDEINQVKDLIDDSLKRKGSIEFNRQQATIKLFDSADTSTLFHELGHLFFRDMEFYSESTDNKKIKAEMGAFKDWLGYEGGEFTVEQNEQFARGFESYLRTGKAPNKELESIFNRLKEWLRSIYQSAKQLNVEMTPEVEAAFAGLFKTNEDILKEKREMNALYDQNIQTRDYVENKSIWYNGKNSIYQKKNSISTFYDRVFKPIESVAFDISPDLFKKMREHSFATHRMAGKDNKIVTPFLEKAIKMEKDDYSTLDLALKNRDNDKVDELSKKYNMEKELTAVRELLDTIYADAQDAGIELGYLDSYFPRMFRSGDVAGLIDLVERRKNQEEYDIKQLKLNPKDAKYSNLFKKLQEHPEWTSEQQAQFVNINIRGFSGNAIFLSTIGNLKHERAVDLVDAEMNQFYMPFTEALATYISSARDNIANKKFFGAERKEVKDVRTNIKRTQTSLEKLQNERKDLAGINTPEVRDQRNSLNEKITKKFERLSELNSILDSKKDSSMEESIGRIVSDMVLDGTIYAKDQQLVKDILKAKFDQQGIGKWGIVRDAGYIATLNDFGNTLTQFGDLALSAYKNGAFNAMAGISTQKRITKEDLGIDKMLAEFGNERGVLSKFLEKQFKFIGFNMVDSLGKNSIINGSILKNKQMAQKNSQELNDKLDFWFADPKQGAQVKQDLLNDEITDDVIFLAFNDLADLQPISGDQLPIAYSKGGGTRLLYALKTYTLKMLDIIRKDIFKEMGKNPKKALKNLVMLQAMILLFGVPKDLVQNLLTGEDETLGETVANNFIMFTILSKYSLGKLFSDGRENTAMDFVMSLTKPPVINIATSIERDVSDVVSGDKDIDEVYSARFVPFIGEGYYWWWGKGAELKEQGKK